MNIEDIDRVIKEESGADPGEGRLPCARALGIARRLNVSPGEIGDALNRLNFRIIDCQLGCFGSGKITPDEIESLQAPEVLIKEILASLVGGRLPCSTAFEVARKVKTSPNEIGKAVANQQVKISSCQLGCFP